jgi:hypothetical protein
MDAMRDAWTDGRLDDLNQRVGDLGRRMDEGFTRIDAKIDGLDSKIDGLDGKIDSRTEGLRAEMRIEFRALNRLILGFGGTVIAAVVADTIVGRL